MRSAEATSRPTDGRGSAILSTVLGGFGRSLISYPMVYVLLALAITSETLYSGFFEFANIRNILTQNASVGIVAVGMTLVIIAGGFDLSVGSTYALGAVIYADLADGPGLIEAFFVAIGVGLLVGLLNGLIVTKANVNPFVATLGTLSVVSGVAFMYSDSRTISPNNPEIRWIATTRFFDLPVSVWILFIVVILGAILLHLTVYGRSIFAVGGNLEAARLVGQRVDALRASTYVVSGGCAALAGVLIASRTAIGQADLGRTEYPLDPIAIVIIGGTSLFGGEGAMWRTVVGLLTLAILTNLFDRAAWSVAAQLLATGTIVIVAVALDAFTRTRNAR